MTKGIIANMAKEELENLILNSVTYSEVLRKLDLHVSSGNFRSLKRKLKIENINYDHIKNGPGYNKSIINSFREKIKLTDALVKNSTYSPSTLKKRLIKEVILIENCAKCGLGSIWQNEKLSLQLDHINGISDDHRIENLRLLCPNCHSQTNTYAGKAKKKKKHKKQRATKINWPAIEDLKSMVTNSNYTQVGILLGVSDNAVRKRIGRDVGNRTLSAEVLEASRLP